MMNIRGLNKVKNQDITLTEIITTGGMPKKAYLPIGGVFLTRRTMPGNMIRGPTAITSIFSVKSNPT